MKKIRAVLRPKSKQNVLGENSGTVSAPAPGPPRSPAIATETNESFPDGLKILHNCDDAVVDICFIHGLTGNRESTWTAEGQSQPWPQTLLPSRLLGSRVLTYGYDAYITPRHGAVASSNRLFDHATNLLNDLTTNRAACNSSTRPLIFVAHSLGGLVCKEMILASRNPTEPHLKNVFDATKGIIFMGTPHTGSWMANWASLPAKTLGVVKSTNQSLLQVLRSSDQYLESIQQRFLALIRDTQHSNRSIGITCFYEELPFPLVGKVVSKDSATFPGYNLISIHANHRNMVRFLNEDETGFQRLLGELQRWAAEIRASHVGDTDQILYASGLSRDSSRARISATSLDRLNPLRENLAPWAAQDPDSSSKPVQAGQYALPRACLETAARLFELGDDDRCLQAVDMCLLELDLREKIEKLTFGPVFASEDARRKHGVLQTETQEIFKDACTKCLRALSFPEMGAREASIEHPLRDTCQWIYDTAAYSSWSSRSSSLLWIKGKPGAGKSTLMKSICARLSKTSRATSSIFLPFFFNGRGAIMEKSPMGLYLTLMCSLLRQNRVLMCEFLPTFLQKDSLGKTGNPRWTWKEIQTIFHSLIEQKQSSSIEILIDALDECDEEEVRIIIRKFERSIDVARQSNASLSVCWSSRHYPTISMLSQFGVEVTMDENNHSDIVQYVKLELPTYLDPLLSSIRDKIISRANGVFLWAALVSKKMLKSVDQGKGEQQLHHLLESIPIELDDLFDDVFEQIDSASQERKELISLAHWILCSLRPLTLKELYSGLCSQAAKTSWSLRGGTPSDGDLYRLRRWVNDVSGGLFEATGTSNEFSRVQVIHETVREYFLSPKGCARLHTPSKAVFLRDGGKELALACFQFFLQEEYDFRLPPEQRLLFPGDDSLASLTAPFSVPRDLPMDFYMQTYVFEHFQSVKNLFGTNDSTGSSILNSTKLRKRMLINYLRLSLDQGAASQSLPVRFNYNIQIVARDPTAFGVTPVEFVSLIGLIGNVCKATALLRDRGIFLSPKGHDMDLEGAPSVEKYQFISVFCILPRPATVPRQLLKNYLRLSEWSTDGDRTLRALAESRTSFVFALRLVFQKETDPSRKLILAFRRFEAEIGGMVATSWEVLHDLEALDWSPAHRRLWQTLKHGEFCDFPSSVSVCIMFRQRCNAVDDDKLYGFSAPSIPASIGPSTSDTIEINNEGPKLLYIASTTVGGGDQQELPPNFSDLERILSLTKGYQLNANATVLRGDGTSGSQ